MEESKCLLERILDNVEDPTHLPFTLLKDITNDFSKERKIGQGGFGEVYKGELGERIVVVKRMHIDIYAFHDNIFHSEVTRLMKINHRNVVRFLGFCSEGYQKLIEEDGSQKMILANVLQRLLCLEYISNGSLDKYITDELRGFEWETRYDIITRICKGLHDLHMEREIFHMNLKPENILLDHHGKYIVPKFTDFGLSRPNKNSPIVGQRGYCAPEYMEEGKTTPACDIYSLGLIIIELVTGCKDVPNKYNVLRRWRHRRSNPLTSRQYQQVTRCIDIAVRCRNHEPEARPSISEIIEFLNEPKSIDNQISPCFGEEDMLAINPLELRLPSELKMEMPCSVELINNTSKLIAFNIILPSLEWYSAQPCKGFISPKSRLFVKIIVQPQGVREQYHVDKFTVQSMELTESPLKDNITNDTVPPKAAKFVDNVDLMVVYESTMPQENCKCREETNMTAEEVPKGEVSSSIRSKNYLSATKPMALTYQELYHITNGFCEKRLIGTGGFGRVYKGVFDDGEVIAVKILNCQPGLVENSFMNELMNHRRIQHQNIIRLVGYCSETRDKLVKYEGEHVVIVEQVRALCLEYMQGGTLEELLSDESCGLDWEARCKIIKGICQGLNHLHTGYKDPIYHMDLKPANILLDKDRIPKIGDFGLSRLLGSPRTFVTKTNSGTLGYMPPEYMHRLQISSKFDVYSLGMIIIQIIAGREGCYNYKCIYNSPQEFVDHVIGNWSKRMQAKTMSTEELLEVQKCIQIALRCVEDNRENRPTITKIVKKLMPELIDLHPAPFCADVNDLEFSL